MKMMKIPTAFPLNADSWVGIVLGNEPIENILLQARTAVNVLLANTRTSGQDYYTLKSGHVLELDLKGGSLPELLGAEKVTDGDFASVAGWTYSDAVWSHDAVNDNIDKDADGTGALTQDVSSVAGELYKVQYEIVTISVGSVTVSVGATSGSARSATGVYVEYITAADDSDLTFTPTDTSRFTLDNVSVKKVLTTPSLYAKSGSGNAYLEVSRLLSF